MKVLHISTSETAGRAAIAARRVVGALSQRGIDARMLVRDRETTNPRVLQMPPSAVNKLKFMAERAEILLHQHLKKEHLWAIDAATHGLDVTTHNAFREADIIHLHWWNQGMLSLEGLRRIIATGKPIVWTMHDMWPFTGICHHADRCQRWLTDECGHCPLILHAAKENDLSRTVYQHKKAVYDTGHMHFVACSDWLADLARKAPLLQGHDVASIPNAIDTHFFCPADRDEARQQLGWPKDQRVILFVAHKVTDPQKGVHYLQRAIRRYAEATDLGTASLAVALVGGDTAEAAKGFDCPVYDLGYVTDPERMRLVYRASDMLAAPTLRDNLPNTIVEAMACGLPCVGFEIGGLPQMIGHHHNGYLAKYCDADDFAAGIRWTFMALSMTTPGDRPGSTPRSAARLKAITSYSEEAVAAQYLHVYEHALTHH